MCPSGVSWSLQRWLLLACVSLMMPGCGGCVVGERTMPVRIIPSDPEPPTPPPQKVAARPTPAPSKPAPAKTKPVAPQAPPRPLDVALWTLDDLFTARDEHDPLLAQAVTQVIKTSTDDEYTTWLLCQLLDKSAAPMPVEAATSAETRPPGNTSAPPQPTVSVTSVIVPHLAASQHELARQTLELVLRGEIVTDLPEERATDIALNALVQHYARYEDLFYSLATEPERWRGDADDDVSANVLQQAAIELMQPLASSTMRMRLAQHITRPATSAIHRERLGPWLADASDPRNLAAQTVLHSSKLLSPQAKAGFRESFSRLNSQSLDYLLGVSSVMRTSAAPVQPATGKAARSKPQLFITSQQPIAAQEPSSDEERALELVRLFWSQEFAASVAQDVGRMADLGAERELMLLASNLPCDAVRRELYRALNRQWADGAAPFQSAKLTIENIRDPGFLLLVKSMPREEVRPLPGGAAKLSAERQAKQAWMAASEGFVTALNKRFFEAARTQPRTAGGDRAVPLILAQVSGTTASSGPAGASSGQSQALPLELHKGANVVAEYHLRWPEELGGETLAQAVSPLVVHYLRLEGEDRFAKVGDYYKRQIDGATSHPTGKGQWIDCLQSEAASGRLRSIDVMITRDQPSPRSAIAAENLLVEVLWIEISDPTRP